ncbi:MAG: Membrane-bound lytic murein transglycosylase D [Saprospiraceae bacterium]|nr:Membrane-bound lytic murein transglycosylase D [Saprospiraceae bacterium]
MNKARSIFNILFATILLVGLSVSPLRGSEAGGRDLSGGVSEELIAERLETMDCLVEPRADADVFDQVRRFIGRDRNRSLELLHRAEVYFPMIDQVFEQYGIPSELKYLTIVESSVVLNAKSYAGAAGLWQLMPATARLLKLRVDARVDQRLDPVMSTQAAARYFTLLYEMFGDWSLVLAAYNCGEYKIKRLLQQAPEGDFWDIRKLLPRQTQLFVPAFIGASYLMEFALDHELETDKEWMDANKLTFARIYKEVRLADLYKKTSIAPEVFKAYNPAYRRANIPASAAGHFISLPDSLMVEFIDYYTFGNEQNQAMSGPGFGADGGAGATVLEIISFSRPLIPSPDNIAVKPVVQFLLDYDFRPWNGAMPSTPETREKENFRYHIVGRRESLSEIAEQNKVSLEDLLSWNEWQERSEPRPGSVVRIRL